MTRLLLVLTILALPALAQAESADDELRKKPITTDQGEVGKLLKKWWQEGTAAGNVGDWYDNRDGEHSPLDLRTWPQLRKVSYTPEDVKAHRHWAWQLRTLPHVVFGNSSTSGPPQFNGSNPRSYYCIPQGLKVLESHYLHNNVYIYPEHRDHDPGHNGVGDGYGDLYPTNTPYLLISQGSSGSDQPFMRALPFTLAAFRPDVKKKLVETGLLMPTVQMILRASNRHLKSPKEYLTGKAHPTVFEGHWVDALKMVKLAHDIRADSIPPLVKLEVKKEDRPQAGRDLFEPPGWQSEQHSDTVSVVARLWRGADYRRRLVVSAEGSLDANKKPLTFTWVVLRGDAKRIDIKPRNKAGSVAAVAVAYHERRPVDADPKIASNRVDIGVFAHNGTHYSAPAFITFFLLDSEGRTYDDRGRIVEIGYGMGETELKLANPAKLFEASSKDELPARVLGLTAEQRGELARVAKQAGPLAVQLEEWRKKRQPVEAARNKAAQALRAAEQGLARLRKDKKGKDELEQAERRLAMARAEQKDGEANWKKWSDGFAKAETAYNQALDAVQPGLKAGPRSFVLARMREAVRRPALWNEHLKALRARGGEPATAANWKRVETARDKLMQLGIVAVRPDKGLELRPALPGKGPHKPNAPARDAQGLSVFQRAMLEQFNAVVLAELVLPKLISDTFHTNFVDARLTAPKSWRDVYHHDGDRLTGWTRYRTGPDQGVSEFTAEGWLVVKKDDKGRPMEARTVVYRQDLSDRRGWVNLNPLRQVAGDERIVFEYEGGKRKIKSRDKVAESK